MTGRPEPTSTFGDDMHLTDDELVLHYYGEMSEGAEARACAHLETCPVCRENLTRLQRVMAAIDVMPIPEPDAFFEQRTWARVESEVVRLKLEPTAKAPEVLRLKPDATRAKPEATRTAPWLPVSGGREAASSGTYAGGRLPWRAMAWGAAAALVVITAFVAGRFSSGPPAAVQSAARTEDAAHERVLLVDLGDHLDRTETALVEFVSGTDGRGIASGRARMEDLVAANRLYRRTAIAAGDRGVADVLDELERVLIEIAGTSPEASTDDLDIVRRRIDTRGLLFKVRVMRGELQQRAKEPARKQGQDTTL